METSISDLRKKDVVNLKDGKMLGRIYDVVFLFPEGKVLGVVVPGTNRWCFVKKAVFIDIRHIVRIGEDTVLVDACYPVEPAKKESCGYRAEPRCENAGKTCPTSREWDGVE